MGEVDCVLLDTRLLSRVFLKMYGGIFDLLPFLGFHIVLLLASTWTRLSEGMLRT
jgi:hypothetical protein